MKTSRIRQYISEFGVFVFIGIIFFLVSFLRLDSDYGWHLQAGRMIFAHGVSTNEYFTYSMPDYPFVDFEWGSHVLMAVLERFGGYGGLAVVYAGVATGSLYMVSRKFTPGMLKSAFVLLAAATLFSFLGIRVQLISWLFFAGFIVMYSQPFRKLNWVIFPGLFMLWANFHGGFVLGIVIFGLSNVLTMVSKRSLVLQEWGVFVVSFLATLINPYGIQLWRETFIIITDSQLRWSISEWLPTIFFIKFSIWVYAGIVAVIGYSERKRIPLVLIGVCLFLFVSAMSSVRNVPYFVLYALFVLSVALPSLEKKLSQNQEMKRRFRICQIVVLSAVMVIFVVEAGLEIRNAYWSSEKVYYPVGAVEYLHTHTTPRNVFTEYSWGGYLIWKYPQKKVFIDGRMSSWRVHRGSVEIDAFQEYKQLIDSKKPLMAFLEKYSIDTVLLPARRDTDSFFNTWNRTLVKNHWQMVYRDSVAEIYRKK